MGASTDAAPRPVTPPSALRWTSTDIEVYLVMERTVMEFAKALMFVGMLRWYFVRKPEEEESKGLPRDKIKAGSLDFVCVGHGLGDVVGGVSGLLHLFEPVYN
jgi:hypothetical protein